MKIAIVPGSFDPLTIGHLDIIERAAKLFDRVFVAIMINPEKNGKFSFAERKEIAELSCAHIKNVKVITADGMLADLAKALGACAIVKGVRNEKDFVYEQEMAYFNIKRNPFAETLYLPCSEELSHISSSLVRKELSEGRVPSDFMAPEALDVIKKHL